MPATPSPSADAPADLLATPPGEQGDRDGDGAWVGDAPEPAAESPGETGEQGERRDAREAHARRTPPMFPRTSRGRLAIAISLVVAASLLLVLAVLPRLLDSYFRQQEDQNLQARATAVGQLLFQQIRLIQRGGTIPILAPTEPLSVADLVLASLTERGTAPNDRSYLSAVADAVAQADLEVAFYPGPDTADSPVAVLRAQAMAGDPASSRESGFLSGSFQLPDYYWSQYGGNVPIRTVTFTLSSPITFRERTITTVFTVLAVVAIAALSLAVVVAFVLADRLTTPLRRLTAASRALAEGRLDARVDVAPTWAPEMTELASAFNRMADRLQESIEYIRHDRDRSREFLADVSHELRTPISALMTFNELLRDGAVNDQATRQEFLDTSHEQIERLDWLAANLLELSKLDSGLIALELRPDDLRSAVESAVQQAEPGAKRKGVELSVEVPAQPLRQRHDAQRMGQVLSNLIGNAVKFTPTGGSVAVTLRGARTGAVISVRDTGVGIDATELPHVFDRFYRGARSTELRAAGSGLGLSIARSIVEMHGGRISISSTLGKGTQVEVVLPKEIAAHDVMESSSAQARA